MINIENNNLLNFEINKTVNRTKNKKIRCVKLNVKEVISWGIIVKILIR